MEKAQVDALNKGMQLLDAVAKKLDITTGHVYDIIVRQQYVNVIETIVSIGVTAAILYYFRKDILKGIRYIATKTRDDEIDGFVVTIAVMLSIVFVILMYLFISTWIGDNVGRLINPEFYAIEYIIDAVKAQ